MRSPRLRKRTHRLRCRVARSRIPEHIMSGRAVGRRNRRHLATCLTCQAEAANYRTLARTLRSLRDEIIFAPRGFALGVMAGLGRPLLDRRHGADRAAVVASVLVVATAMAVLGRRRFRTAG